MKFKSHFVFHIGLILCLLIFFASSIQAEEYAIQLDGNRYFSRSKIIQQLNFPSNENPLTRADWESWREEAVRSLSMLYQEDGFFDSQFRIDFTLDSLRQDSVTAFDIRIQERIRYRFGRARVESRFAPNRVDISELRCQGDRPFERKLLYKDLRDIILEFGNYGFLHAKAAEEIEVDTTHKMVNVVFHVESGPALIFDSLHIQNRREGDTTGKPGLTSQKFLRELLNLKSGDTISLAKTTAYERKLRSTHVFNVLRLKDTVLDIQNGKSALQFNSEERIPGSMEASLFYETQYGPGISGGFLHGNLFGKLKAGEVKTTLSQRRQSLYGKYSSLLFLMTPFRFDNELLMQWTQDADPTRKLSWFEGDFDVVNDSRFSRGFAEYFRYVAGAQLRVRRLLGPEGQLRDSTLNYLNSIFFNYLDDLFRPTSGIRASTTWGNGGPVLASGEINIMQRRHNWGEGETAIYWPFFAGMGLALRIEGGHFFGEGGANSERFYLGGPRNVRSYGWRKICPEVINGQCLHEGQEPEFVLGSFEARLGFPPNLAEEDHWYHYLTAVQVVPFFDYGVIRNVGQAVNPSGRGRALGMGIRYALFNLFNLRLDYALDPWRENQSQWCIDLAQAF